MIAKIYTLYKEVFLAAPYSMPCAPYPKKRNVTRVSQKKKIVAKVFRMQYNIAKMKKGSS